MAAQVEPEPAERVEPVPATRRDGSYSREFLEALMQLPPGRSRDRDDSD